MGILARIKTGALWYDHLTVLQLWVALSPFSIMVVLRFFDRCNFIYVFEGLWLAVIVKVQLTSLY